MSIFLKYYILLIDNISIIYSIPNYIISSWIIDLKIKYIYIYIHIF